MNIEDTIRVLSHERICVMRQIEPGCDRDCAACDLVLPDELVISAYQKAVNILRAQQEAEKNELLPLEELRRMDGQPVYVMRPRYGQRWALVNAYQPLKIYLTYSNGSSDLAEWLIDDGAKIYRRLPKEAV